MLACKRVTAQRSKGAKPRVRSGMGFGLARGLGSVSFFSGLKIFGSWTQKFWFVDSRVLVCGFKSFGLWNQKFWFADAKVLVGGLKSLGSWKKGSRTLSLPITLPGTAPFSA